MPTELERDLGLYAVLTISMGAMIGSGIFVLPGKAAEIAGPAVILAYLLAGVLVLPAALSKAEMATAMPESGGTYLYIDRAMGPFMGTIAGIGAWFSLVFKSAFALVGLGAYLVLFADVAPKPVALGLGAAIVGVNLVGVKQTGRLQAAIVTAVLFVLGFFIADGLTFVESARYHPFFPGGSGSVVAAAGFVFVSYAGVTKIASVAEEVENPDRNIPIGMLLSIVLMLVVYTLVVYVVVGTTVPDRLHETLTPMAVSARGFLGRTGVLLVVAVAVLALTSMANAGVLSSSRYPLALARDDLAPPTLSAVNDRFGTPHVAILVTGVVLVGLIATLPVVELAKLASAFKILVFSLVNVALVAFRESDIDAYDPAFTAPGYPWVQLVGILGGGVLLTQMGPLPLAGAVGIIVVGAVWYRLYGRDRTEREGAALDAIRQSSGERLRERTRELLSEAGSVRALVPLSREADDDEVETLLWLASAVARGDDDRVHAVTFEEVPEQMDLASAAADDAADGSDRGDGTVTVDDSRADDPAVFADGASGVRETVVSHDTKRAVTNYAADHDVDLIVGGWHPDRWRAKLLGSDVDWYMTHAPCDTVFVRDRGIDGVDEIVVVSAHGPNDPLEILVADAVARERDARIRFLSAVEADAPDERVESVGTYQRELAGYCDARTECTVLRTDDRASALAAAADGADLVVVGTVAHHLVYDVLFGTVPDRLVERLDCTVLLAHSRRSRGHTFLRAVLDRLVYW